MVPAVYPELCSKMVLVMEEIYPAVPLTRALEQQGEKVAKQRGITLAQLKEEQKKEEEEALEKVAPAFFPSVLSFLASCVYSILVPSLNIHIALLQACNMCKYICICTRTSVCQKINGYCISGRAATWLRRSDGG